MSYSQRHASPYSRQLSARQKRVLVSTGCELHDDRLTRVLYATDASIYQVPPLAVAFPRRPDETSRLVDAAGELGLVLTPRGAGTGLTGGALGDDVVIDLARYNRSIKHLDREQRQVTVEPGVVLDQLNRFLQPHGLWFGPDVATSSRATLGGMIGNNSSGAYAGVYGTTVDHVLGLELVGADASVQHIERRTSSTSRLSQAAAALISEHAAAIASSLPTGLLKRCPGYGLDTALADPHDLTRLLTGSEGTLAAITAATLNLEPLPQRRGLGVVCFASVLDALQATSEMLDLAPATIEHLDRLLFDRTKGQREFESVRSLLDLDLRPCAALLLVEFFDNVEDRLAELSRRMLGLRTLCFTSAREQQLVWAMRKAGLSLLTSSPGPTKTVTCIEDVCVEPRRLPAYVAAVQEVLEPLGVEASFYGHAASGLLHIRPRLDLHTDSGVVKLRQISDQISQLCRQFSGSLAGEHGIGIARTEYLEDQIGPDLMQLSRRIKSLFDPHNRFNAGKIVPTGRFHVDRDLRLSPELIPILPFREQLTHVDRDHSFLGNLEQCNGCGACLKLTPTMCPSFQASGEEDMSTRGRANLIRSVLTGGLGDPRQGLLSPELDTVLSSCLSCKACRRECPSNVDLSLLKADLTHARHSLGGAPLVDRVITAADTVGRLGSASAPLSNILLSVPPLRWLVASLLGFDARRRLPRFTSQRFDHWFARTRHPSSGHRRGLILWDDTWVRYYDPGIGKDAVAALHAMGFAVQLADGRVCCGRPAASRGRLDQVRACGEHNLHLLRSMPEDAPIVFLEPSCYTMFVDEYRQLGLAGAEEVAARCVLFESLVLDLLEGEPALAPTGGLHHSVAIHTHCHAKAMADPQLQQRLAGMLTSGEVRMLETGCCGMAGAYGMLRKNRALSRRLAVPLLEAIDALPADATLVASGFSCRQQITDLSCHRPVHIAELVAQSLTITANKSGAFSVPESRQRTSSPGADRHTDDAAHYPRGANESSRSSGRKDERDADLLR